MDAALQSTTLGRYTAIASLGRGGMAEIYLALMSGPSGFNKLMVLKILRGDLEASRDELQAMFLDEARLAAKLHHRSIVQTYEFGDVQGRPFLAMEYLEGQPLRAVQRRFAPSGLPLSEELRILVEVAHALHYAHELKDFDGQPLSVVHRDVSPQNVFLTYEGQVKLLDFGIAKASSDEHLTQVGAIQGKIDYMAPEQVRGEAVDRRADVFALGVMLWEAVTGARFGGGSKVPEFTKIHRRLTGAEPNVRELRPDVPEALASIIDESLALTPEARLPTAAEFAKRLERYLATLSVAPSERSLSELLVARYQAERQSVRQLIDQQVKRISERGPGSAVPRSTMRPLDFNMTASGFLDLGAGKSASTELPLSEEHPIATVANVQPPPQPKRSTLVVGATALLFVALVTTVTLVTRRGHDSATAAAPTGSAQASGSLAASPGTANESGVVPQTVRIVIEATPPGARAKLDGAPLSELPFTGTFQASDAIHHLEVSAKGYETVRQLVTFNGDRTLSIQLEPVSPSPALAPRVQRRPAPSRQSAPPPSAPAPSASPPPAQAAPPPARSDAPAPGVEFRTKPKTRRFDMDDPYAD